MIAYCFASGQIEFRRTLPDGAIEIARGRAAALKKLIRVTARMAYDGKTMLVPGIPEAQGDDRLALQALKLYCSWLALYPRQGIEINPTLITITKELLQAAGSALSRKLMDRFHAHEVEA